MCVRGCKPAAVGCRCVHVAVQHLFVGVCKLCCCQPATEVGCCCIVVFFCNFVPALLMRARSRNLLLQLYNLLNKGFEPATDHTTPLPVIYYMTFYLLIQIRHNHEGTLYAMKAVQSPNRHTCAQPGFCSRNHTCLLDISQSLFAISHVLQRTQTTLPTCEALATHVPDVAGCLIGRPLGCPMMSQGMSQ